MAAHPALLRLLVCLGIAGLGLGLGAQAQVVRCTDARTGKVTYTDGACASGSATHEVEARKLPEELQREREIAAEALERKQQRLQAEADAEQAEARRSAERDRARAAQARDYASSAECARSRRQLDIVASGLSRTPYEQDARLETAQRQVDLDCLGPQGYAEVEKARANQPRVVVMPPAVRPRPVFPVSPPTTPPRRNVQCNVFRCTDGQGNTYPAPGLGR